MYHYTESGLRNVYLLNGYEEIETPYGTAVTVENVDGLHKAIARSLIRQPFLSGRELRFLRIELDKTQREIGEYLGVQAQTVAKWEKQSRVPRWADLMIRAIYRDLPVRAIPQIFAAAAEERFAPQFKIRRRRWSSQAAA